MNTRPVPPLHACSPAWYAALRRADTAPPEIVTDHRDDLCGSMASHTLLGVPVTRHL